MWSWHHNHSLASQKKTRRSLRETFLGCRDCWLQRSCLEHFPSRLRTAGFRLFLRRFLTTRWCLQATYLQAEAGSSKARFKCSASRTCDFNLSLSWTLTYSYGGKHTLNWSSAVFGAIEFGLSTSANTRQPYLWQDVTSLPVACLCCMHHLCLHRPSDLIGLMESDVLSRPGRRRTPCLRSHGRNMSKEYTVFSIWPTFHLASVTIESRCGFLAAWHGSYCACQGRSFRTKLKRPVRVFAQ